jgi:GTPase SAR1 family protein
VFDITRKESFEKIPSWMDNLLSTINDTIPTILVGNKCDLDSLRVVTFEEGKLLAEKLSTEYKRVIPFFEASAKTNQNVEELFVKLGSLMLEERIIEFKNATEWQERAEGTWW